MSEKSPKQQETLVILGFAITIALVSLIVISAIILCVQEDANTSTKEKVSNDLHIQMATIKEIKLFSKVSDPKKISSPSDVGFAIKLPTEIRCGNVISDTVLFPFPLNAPLICFWGLMVAYSNPNQNYCLKDFYIEAGNDGNLYASQKHTWNVELQEDGRIF